MSKGWLYTTKWVRLSGIVKLITSLMGLIWNPDTEWVVLIFFYCRSPMRSSLIFWFILKIFWCLEGNLKFEEALLQIKYRNFKWMRIIFNKRQLYIIFFFIHSFYDIIFSVATCNIEDSNSLQSKLRHNFDDNIWTWKQQNHFREKFLRSFSLYF